MSDDDDRPDTERTREGDAGRAARALVLVHKWKDAIIAGVLLPTAIGCGILGWQVYSLSAERARDAAAVRVIAEQQATQQKATATAAKVSCQRSRRLGPLLADYYALDPSFPRDVLAEYRKTIPRDCPK